MKYKVLYQVNNSGGGDPDVLSGFSFYIRAQAVASAQSWAEAIDKNAFVWDGVQWTTY